MENLLDSRQLRAFLAVAKTGSFTKGARTLRLTQSAVSHAIKGLERDLHTQLFEKSGKYAVLNQAGEQLLARADRISDEMKLARTDLKHLSEWGRGRLRIGASTTACQYILPAVLREFRESFPKYSISIEPTDGPQGAQLLEENRVDLALTLQPWMDPRFEFREIFIDELFFVVSPFHPWVTLRRAPLLEIPKEKYILYPRNSYTFQMIESYFQKENITLNSIIEFGSMEAIKEMVKIGMGVGILTPWVAIREIEEGKLMTVPLGKRKLRRHWGIVFMKSKRLNLAEETFVSLCKSVSEELLAPLQVEKD